jgi:hypothetical protein
MTEHCGVCAHAADERSQAMLQPFTSNHRKKRPQWLDGHNPKPIFQGPSFGFTSTSGTN